MTASLAVVPNAIPDDLKAFDQWVVWKHLPKNGKATKKPFNARTGQAASVRNPGTWSTFSEAVAAVSKYDGFGFVLTQQDPYVGLDLDHCVDPASGPDSGATAIVRTLNTYTEFSPSGTGIRILARGKLPSGGRRQGQFEIYDCWRFLTLTGCRLEGSPLTIEERTDALVRLHERMFGVAAVTLSGVPDVIRDGVRDDEILRHARQSTTGQVFERLWAGDCSVANDDHSASDLALCSRLAWAGGDREAIDRLFRRSGLLRGKWDEPHSGDGRTYGEMTIAKALTERPKIMPAAGSRVTAATLVPVVSKGTTQPPRPSLTYDRDDNRPVRLASLFRGRRDMLWDNPHGIKRQEATWGVYRGHLQGKRDLGILPLFPNGTCCWARAHVTATEPDRILNLVRLLNAHGIQAMIVRDKPTVFDLYVFPDNAVEAGAIRSVLHNLAAEAGLARNVKIVPSADISEGDPRVAGHALLPYVGAIASEHGDKPRHKSSPGCRVAIDFTAQRDLTLDEFLDAAESSRTPAKAITEAAARVDNSLDRSVKRPSGPRARKRAMARPQSERDVLFLEAAHRMIIESGAPPGVLQVLLELWLSANPETGITWLGAETLADRTRTRRPTVFRALKWLREVIKIVEPVKEHRIAGRWPRVGHRLVLVGGRRPL